MTKEEKEKKKTNQHFYDLTVPFFSLHLASLARERRMEHQQQQQFVSIIASNEDDDENEECSAVQSSV